MGADGTATMGPAPSATGATLHERRWQRLWEAMERQGVAALGVYGRGSLGSYGPLHFLTGCFAAPKGGFGLVEPGRPPVLVAGSEIEAGLLGAGARAAGVEVRRGPHPSAAASTGALLAAAAGDRPVGLTSPPGGVPAGDLALLRGAAEGTEVRDLSAAFEEVRTDLDPEDVRLLEDAAAGAEAAIARFAASFAVGISEREAAAEIDAELSRRGALTRIVFVAGGSFQGRPPSERPLRAGEPITVLVEQAAPSGHWVEIGVIAAAGSLDAEAQRVADACVAALRAGATGLRPGAPCGQVAAAMEGALRERGGRPISNLGHGTGVDEATPPIAAHSTAPVRAGTAFALHPSYTALSGADEPTATVANTFVVAGDPSTEGEPGAALAPSGAAARPLSALPFELLELA